MNCDVQKHVYYILKQVDRGRVEMDSTESMPFEILII